MTADAGSSIFIMRKWFLCSLHIQKRKLYYIQC